MPDEIINLDVYDSPSSSSSFTLPTCEIPAIFKSVPSYLLMGLTGFLYLLGENRMKTNPHTLLVLGAGIIAIPVMNKIVDEYNSRNPSPRLFDQRNNRPISEATALIERPRPSIN